MSRILSTFFSYNAAPLIGELELLKTFVNRVHDLEPNIKIIVTTDSICAEFLEKICVTLKIMPVRNETLLLDRCKANYEVLTQFKGAEQIIFSDYDVIFNTIPAPDSIESLMLTVRNIKHQPINGGLLAFSNPSEISILLYKTILQHYLSLSANNQRWWGDQISLYEVLKKNSDDLFALREFVYKGLCIRPVSTVDYNWTPFDFDSTPETHWKNFFISESSIKDYSTRRVLHFKGPRKHLMMQFARSDYGLSPEKRPEWFNLSSHTDVMDRLNQLCAKLTKGFLANDSVWEISDQIFSFIPVLNSQEKTNVLTLSLIHI